MSHLVDKKIVLNQISFVSRLLADHGYSFDLKKLNQPELWSTKQRIVLQVSKGDNKYIFKKLINHEQKYQDFFLQEQNILSFFSRRTPPFSFNHVFDSSLQDDWFVASLAIGDCPGDVLTIDRSVNLEKFSKELISSLEYFQQLSDAQDLKLPHFDDIKRIPRLIELLQENGFGRFEKYLSDLEKNNLGYSLDKSNYRFSHGDLSPINMLFDGESVSIIDWESAGYRINTYDAGYIAHRFWKDGRRDEKNVAKIRDIFSSGAAQNSFDFWLDYWAFFDICVFERYSRGKNLKTASFFRPVKLKNAKIY